MKFVVLDPWSVCAVGWCHYLRCRTAHHVLPRVATQDMSAIEEMKSVEPPVETLAPLPCVSRSRAASDDAAPSSMRVLVAEGDDNNRASFDSEPAAAPAAAAAQKTTPSLSLSRRTAAGSAGSAASAGASASATSAGAGGATGASAGGADAVVATEVIAPSAVQLTVADANASAPPGTG
jgi:hypothetical protein